MKIKLDQKYLGYGASCVAIGVGFLGGHILKVVNPAISPVGHALALGLTIPFSKGIHHLLKDVEIHPLAKGILATFGGYIAALITSNRIGFSVSFMGPMVSTLTVMVVGLPLAACGMGAFLLVTRSLPE